MTTPTPSSAPALPPYDRLLGEMWIYIWWQVIAAPSAEDLNDLLRTHRLTIARLATEQPYEHEMLKQSTLRRRARLAAAGR